MERLEDLFIDNLKIYQDDDKYCFTSDAILLSRFIEAKQGEVVADFCSGSGIVGLNFFALNKEKVKSVTLFELQKPLFDLSMKSVKINGLEHIFDGVNGKIQDIDEKYKGAFSLILCNPPYIKKGCGYKIPDEEIALCKVEEQLSLSELMVSVSFALKNGGRVVFCHRVDRICDLLYEMREKGIEPKRIQIVLSNENKPYLVLVEGVKGAKPGLKVLNNIIN